MKIDTLHRVDITLFDADIQTMREIVRLAHERIHSSPTVQLRGAPLERQAGLVGPDLFRVKEAIEKIGMACGISLPYESESEQGTGLVTTQHQRRSERAERRRRGVRSTAEFGGTLTTKKGSNNGQQDDDGMGYCTAAASGGDLLPGSLHDEPATTCGRRDQGRRRPDCREVCH